jgi:ATP-dependent DNA helicase PIF1
MASAYPLNEDQQYAVDLMSEGTSIFITGPAGTGKSLTIAAVVENARKRRKTVYVCATTGVAASLLAGSASTGVRTLHSWAGIGLGKFSPTNHASYIARNKGTTDRLRGTDVLIVDEVSMTSPEYINKLDAVLRIVRKSGLPFGGIQVLFSGDFSQLPPISKDKKEPYYLFEDPIWTRLIEKVVVLSKVYRQTSPEFVEVLMKIRENNVDEQVMRVIQGTSTNTLSNPDGIKPTVLFCMNKDVDKMNQSALDRLPGSLSTSVAKDFYKTEKSRKENENGFSCVETLNLKVGAQVMLLINIDPNACLVNGSRGVVTHLPDKNNELTVCFLHGQSLKLGLHTQEIEDDHGKVVAYRRQFPFKLAFALTVHKSQGSTIDLLIVDLKGAFSPGQAYVAISRGTSLENMRVLNFAPHTVKTCDKVSTYHDSIALEYNKRPRGGDEDENEIETKKLKQ